MINHRWTQINTDESKPFFTLLKTQAFLRSAWDRGVKLLLLSVSICVHLWLILSLQGCQSDTPNLGNFPTGVVDSCRAQPKFMAKTGLGRQIAIDSRQRGYTGLRLQDVQTGKTWQHETWDDAGHVGAFERDRQGNIYVAPTPEVSLKENPPELQNRIYRIDAQTAKMRLFMELPWEKPPSPSNPFGVLGLAYDCNTDSLYASSVAGSSGKEELGTIYQINVQQKKIINQLNNTDVIGVGIFNTKKDKRLFYGSARSSNVFSIGLDAKGSFYGEPRYEFSLATLQGGNSTIAKKIRFKKQGQNNYIMTVKEMEFGFRLPAENNPFTNKYLFQYQKDDVWKFLGVKPE